MADAVYKLGRVSEHPSDEGARLAVYTPLCHLPTYSAELRREFYRGCFKLIHSRRRRLAKMAEAGQAALQDPRRLQRARNCPPALFKTHSPSLYLPCKLSDFCPFCAARKARDLYELAWKVKQPKDRLVAFTDSIAVPYAKMSVLELMHRARKALKGLVVGANGPSLRGYFWSVAIEPGYLSDEEELKYRERKAEEDSVLLPERGRVSAWVVTRSCLAFMLPGENFCWAPENCGTMSGKVSRDNLVEAVAMVCRYPVGLFRGDLAKTVEFMNLRGQVRLNERGGCLRNKLLTKEHTNTEFEQ